MPFPIPGRVAEMVRRSTVQIRNRSERHEGNGSGIVLTDGRVLTNCHVSAGGGELTIEAWENSTARARVLKKDSRRDLALLEADRLSAPPIAFSSITPRNGQQVIAVGNPFGFVGAVSTGTIHRLSPVSGLGMEDWIQSDVRLAPGNSGGPLADIHGDLLGINTMIAGPFALAIPLHRVQAFLSTKPLPSALGVTVRPITLTRLRNRRMGLVVLEVEKDSPAEQASLFAGDVLVGAAGKDLRSPDDLHQAIERQGTLVLDFLRANGQQIRRVAVRLSQEQTVNAA